MAFQSAIFSPGTNFVGSIFDAQLSVMLQYGTGGPHKVQLYPGAGHGSQVPGFPPPPEQ